MTMTLAQLEALVTSQGAEILRLRSEMGAYDKDATPWHQRQGQLTDAFDAMAARLADIPGGQLASEVIIARVAAAGGVSSPPSSTSGDVVFDNVTVNGKLSIAGPILPDADPQLQIHGKGAAEILLISNEAKLDPQNPQYPHPAVISGGNDGGVRLIQGGYWGKNGFVKGAPNRNLVTVALDSLGTLSYNTEKKDGTDEKCQFFTFEIDQANKIVRLRTNKAGWGVAVGGSTTTNSVDRNPAPLVPPL